MDSAPKTTPARAKLAAAAALVLLIWATYWPVCTFGFAQWDDAETVWKNPDFNPVSVRGVARYWREPHMDLYVPVTYTFWGAVTAAAGGKANPHAFHAANVLLLCAGSVAAMLLLCELTGSVPAALLGAAVFAVHPVQAEPVGWVSGGKDLLYMALSLAALWQYVRWAKGGKWEHYAIATVAFVLAMFSKPTAIVVPALAAVIHYGLLRGNVRRVAWGVVPWVVLAVPVAVIGKIVQPAGVAAEVPVWLRPAVAGDALAFYLYKLVAPVWLAVDYGRAPERVIASAWGKLAWLVPAALAVALWAWRRVAPWGLVAAALLVLSVGPVLGLVRFDFQRYSTVADHYLCLAMIGPAVAVAFAVRSWGRRATVVAALFVLVLAGRTFAQVWAWRDTETLFHHTLAVNPGSLAANGVLAVRASGEGRYDEAWMYFRRALATRPNDAVTRYNYANALMRSGDIDGAIAQYRRAVALNPRHAPMRNNFGIALMRANRPADAIDQFREAVRIDPQYAEGHLDLGQALAVAGDYKQAADELRRALDLNPDLAKARAMLDAIRRAPATVPATGVAPPGR